MTSLAGATAGGDCGGNAGRVSMRTLSPRPERELITDGHEGRVHDQMAQPRSQERAGSFVQPGPDDAAQGDRQRKRQYRLPESARKVTGEDDDVMAHESQTGEDHGDCRIDVPSQSAV